MRAGSEKSVSPGYSVTDTPDAENAQHSQTDHYVLTNFVTISLICVKLCQEFHIFSTISLPGAIPALLTSVFLLLRPSIPSSL